MSNQAACKKLIFSKNVFALSLWHETNPRRKVSRSRFQVWEMVDNRFCHFLIFSVARVVFSFFPVNKLSCNEQNAMNIEQ